MLRRISDAIRDLELLELRAQAVTDQDLPKRTKELRLANIRRAIHLAERVLRDRAEHLGLDPDMSPSLLREQVALMSGRRQSELDESWRPRMSRGRRASDMLRAMGAAQAQRILG